MEPIINGVGIGLMLAVLPGPVFFALVQAGMDKGVMSGLAMALGIMLSDVTYMFVTYTGLTELGFSSDSFNFWLGIVGGLIMLVFGGNLMMTRVKFRTSISPKVTQAGALKLVGTGYALNALNPAVVLFWIGVNGWLLKQEYSSSSDITYFAAIALTVFGTDTLKVYFSRRLSRWLTIRNMLWIKRGIGLFLGLFGFKLLISAFI